MRRKIEASAVWLQEHFVAVELLTCAIAIAAVVYSGLQYYSLAQEYAAVRAELASSTLAYKQITANLRERFAIVTGRNQELSDSLSLEQQKNNQFEAQLNGVKGQVDQLQTLADTDKELLQKYSKVFFLNENYEPASTTILASKYVYETKTEQRFLEKAAPFLTRMLDDAERAGVDIKVLSAYRSYGYQSSLKTEYRTTYGSGANAFSADQGYSEHQLATAVDFTTTKIGENFSSTKNGFDSSDGFKWLEENAHKYGFILSYPKGNSFYVYEPWHWRFVGTALAKRLHDEKKSFYDLDQRDIDPYLLLIFN